MERALANDPYQWLSGSRIALSGTPPYPDLVPRESQHMKMSWRSNLIVLQSIIRTSAENILAIIGAIVAVAGFVALITSKTLRHWIKAHPYIVFVALIISLVIVMITLNYARDLRLRYASLAQRAKQQDPSATGHDKEMLKQFLATIPPTGRSIMWLKQEFDPASLPADHLRTLEKAVRSYSLNPVGFDDQSASVAYQELMATIDAFSEKIRRWTTVDARDALLEIPEEWRFERRSRYQTAITEISQARDATVEAYDRFLHICHRVGIDHYDPRSVTGRVEPPS
jgi:hypothetical protein